MVVSQVTCLPEPSISNSAERMSDSLTSTFLNLYSPCSSLISVSCPFLHLSDLCPVLLCPSRSLFLCSLQLYFAVRIFSTFSDFLSIHSRRSAAICRPLRQLTIFYSSCISIFCDSYSGPRCLYIHRSLFPISVSVEEAV